MTSLALLLAAATLAAAPQDKIVHGSLSYQGRERTYRVFVPASLKPRPALVLVLHGGFGTGDGAATQTGFDGQARKAGFVVAYPDGIGRSWNALTCCGPAQSQKVDDVGFLSRLIDTLAARYKVDRDRTYATGISNGGLMSYVLACRLADKIAAIGPVAATMDLDGCTPSRPVSVVHIHGLADKNIPFNGGRGSKGVTSNDWRSVPDTIDRWRRLDGCTDELRRPPGEYELVRYLPCRRKTEVALYTLPGGGHSWPGGERISPLLDPPSTLLDATQTIWRFFASHARV
jgi:polyhydroxybutyrate depolymerase